MLQPPDIANSSTYGPPTDPIAPLRAALGGHYEIEREIGQGAFATVYLARDLKHERKVAIKVLNADPTSDLGELRFIREIRMLARLQHPNILPLHDSGHVEALLYYVMPYVSGETLRDRISRLRQLPVEEAACIAHEAADALDYAHGQGIIHRDVKPENILLSGDHAVVADFGIARAIDLAGIRQLTRTGVGSPGTPAYMAPEQLLGERAVDYKSDIYSLGCVLYEALTGKPPFLGKDGFVKRFTEPAPVPSAARQDIPRWLDTVVAKALSRNPADRYSTAAEFARALTMGLAEERSKPAGTPAIVSHPTTIKRGTASVPSWIPRSRFAAIVAAVAVTISLGTALVARREGWLGGSTTPDPTRFAVLPFAASDNIPTSIAARTTDRLYSALRGWKGLDLVSDLQVADVSDAPGRAPRSLSEARSMASRVGAGSFIWGHVSGTADSTQVRAELYDFSAAGSISEVVLDNRPGSAEYARAALSLLTPPGVPAGAIAAAGGTHNYQAWSAYTQGHTAAAHWDLDGAQAAFTKAVAADPTFAAAQLWLGQLLEWKHPSLESSWDEYAERAATAATTLAPRDSLLAIALYALAQRRYPAACDAYTVLARSDSADFVPWYGLGECQRLDRVVLPDPSSPSGWRWRSSYDAALRAYVRALRLEPGAHHLLSFDRLRGLLPTAVTPRLDEPSAPRFAAFPSLAADTLAFVPYPIEQVRTGLPASATATLNAALDRNIDLLFNLASEWVRVAPQSADAYESLADVLEARGDIQPGSDPLTSAAAAASRARALSSDDQQHLRLAALEARLRFRQGDYAGLVSATDSLLRNREVDTNDPPALIGLAALTGRIGEVTRQATEGVIAPRLNGVTLSAPLKQAASALFAFAALGACGDSLRALVRTIDREIESSIAEKDQQNVRIGLTARPLMMMTPCNVGDLGRQSANPSSGLYQAQQAFARRNFTEVRKQLQLRLLARRAYRPSDVSMDYVYQEAWLRAAIGDTAIAIAQLDRSLNGIPMISSTRLSEPGAAAAIVLAMVLRADLAAATNQRTDAMRWGRAVATLWMHADPPLKPTVDRMRALSNAPIN
ncbi:MAG TPA: serine/threonine-protein kinase [Gemmatimonadaceae bacterium]|nr:serine/threonine-protein kinase [Gemmatimonadaceae bacterium]